MNHQALSASEDAAASRILAVLQGHTLALRLTGAYSAVSHRSLESIATDLEGLANAERGGSVGDIRQRAVLLAFHQSARQLPDAALALFTLLAIFRANDVGKNAVLAVARAMGIKDKDASQHLEGLINLALVDVGLNERIPVPADRDRLILHPMLRVFADDLLSHWNSRRQDAARRAAARYYADYATFVTDRWLAPDEENIISALEWAHENDERELVAEIAYGMRSFWDGRGRARASKPYLLWGMRAADEIARETQRGDDRLRAARLANSYGAALSATGQLNEAEVVFTESLALQRAMEDHQGESLVLTNLGRIAKARGVLREAEGYFQKALEISEADDNVRGRAANIMYLGQVAQARGQLTRAQQLFERSLALFREVKDPQGEGEDLESIAFVELVRGHGREAEVLFRQSLSLRRENDDLAGQANALSLLGQLCLARGDLSQTASYLTDSLLIRREGEDRYGEAGDLCQLGRLSLVKGEFDTSASYFRESLSIFRELHAHADEGVAISQLGLVALEQKRYGEATNLLERSLTIRQEVQDPRGEGVDHALLGRIALEQGEYSKAAHLYQISLKIARTIGNRRGEGVNLRQLGKIAERRQTSKRAEVFYRAGLAIAREVENALDIADASLALGCLLSAQHIDPIEGCQLLLTAESIYARMQVPGLHEARDAIARWGCER